MVSERRPIFPNASALGFALVLAHFFAVWPGPPIQDAFFLLPAVSVCFILVRLAVAHGFLTQRSVAGATTTLAAATGGCILIRVSQGDWSLNPPPLVFMMPLVAATWFSARLKDEVHVRESDSRKREAELESHLAAEKRRVIKLQEKGREAAKRANRALHELERLAPLSDAIGGRWILKKLLPGGTFGQVWIASDGRDEHRTAVVKLLPVGGNADLARALLAREIDALSKMRSHNIVRFYDGGFDPSHGWFLVTECGEGGSLDVLLENESAARLSFMFFCIKELLRGLRDAHRVQPPIIHADVKPANVVADKDWKRVMLVDFGIAQMRAARSQAGETLGRGFFSNWYAAPEQVPDEPYFQRKLTPATDIYSTGAVAYRMVTGLAPFQAETLLFGRNFETLIKAGFEPASAAQINPRVPQALSSMIGRWMSRDPQLRPQGAQAALRQVFRVERRLGVDREIPILTADQLVRVKGNEMTSSGGVEA